MFAVSVPSVTLWFTSVLGVLMWYRVFGLSESEPSPATLAEHLHAAGLAVEPHFKGDDLGWTAGELRPPGGIRPSRAEIGLDRRRAHAACPHLLSGGSPAPAGATAPARLCRLSPDPWVPVATEPATLMWGSEARFASEYPRACSASLSEV